MCFLLVSWCCPVPSKNPCQKDSVQYTLRGVFHITWAMPLFVDICNLFQNPKPTWLYCFVLVMLCVSLCLWHCPGVSPMESLAKRDRTRDAKANWPCKTCSCGSWGGGSVSFVQWFLGAKGFVWLKIPCQQGYIFCCYQLIPLEFQFGSSRI